MNQLMLVALAVVAFCYFGGNNCPSVLRQNKEMLLGVLVGLVLCSFMGMRLEGLIMNTKCCENIDHSAENMSGKVAPVLSSDGCVSCPGGGIECEQYRHLSGLEEEYVTECEERASVAASKDS